MAKFYWLIEKESPAQYYVSGHTPNIEWTSDPAEATRFASERTANHGIYGCFSSSEAMLDRVRVCEHMDCGSHSALVKAREWLASALPECCGERDASGTCFAPACSRGEAFGAIDDAIAQLADPTPNAEFTERRKASGAMPGSAATEGKT